MTFLPCCPQINFQVISSRWLRQRKENVGSHLSEFPDLRIALSTGYPCWGGWGHRERSSRYPGQVRVSWVSVGFNFLEIQYFGDVSLYQKKYQLVKETFSLSFESDRISTSLKSKIDGGLLRLLYSVPLELSAPILVLIKIFD